MSSNAEAKMTPSDLGIDMAGANPEALYRWFLASLLFGKRIRQETAAKTYHELILHGLTSPDAFAHVSRERLMRMLTDGGYTHYRWREDDELHDIMADITGDYGTVDNLVRTAGSPQELEQRLLRFNGVGPVTARIFMEWIPEKAYGTM